MLSSLVTKRNYLLFIVSLLFGVVAFAAPEKDPAKAITARLQKAYNGKVIALSDEIPKTLDEELEKFLKEKSKKDAVYTFTADEKKTWTINLMAFLNKDPGGADLTMVFYDKDNKEAIKNLEPVQNIDLKSTKGQKIIRLSAVALTEDAGFVAGKTYLLKITQLKGGKEVSLAEAQIVLSAAKE